MKIDIYKCFIPECCLDTLLIEVLLKRSNAVNHGKGNSSVASKMKEERMLDCFAVGIIDKDKIEVKDLAEYESIEKLNKEQLKLFRHPVRPHYIIQICPAIEKWILNECRKAGISLTNYELPDDVKKLAKMKSQTQRSDPRFKRLFKDMAANENCDEAQELLRWLEYLRDNNFNANTDLL